jgi:lipoate-protein ligase A
MLFLETGSTDCYYNMAFEEYAFERLDPREEYFSLWQNDNAIVVGRHQNTVAEINQDYVRENDVRVVRRLSGGGAVYHDLGNLNFTFITDSPNTETNAPDFAFFTKPVLKALKEIGVHAELSGRNDLTIEGKKLSGNAQLARRGRVLHHGTLMFQTNLDALEAALTPSALKLHGKAVTSVKSRVTNISAHTKATMEAFRAALLDSLFLTSDSSLFLSAEAISEISALRAEKYATWDWNYGSSPPYTLRTEKRFPFGVVELLLDVKHGKIETARLFGDFFGFNDLTPLESALRGARLTVDGISAALSGVDIGAFIIGMRNEDLENMICVNQ